MNKSKVVIVQTRSSSKRLPGKALLPFLEKELIVEVVKNLRTMKMDLYVLTSSEESDDDLVSILNREQIKYYRGSLENVYKRIFNFLKLKNYSDFIRINGDSPFIPLDLLEEMVEIHSSGNYQITTNVFPRTFAKGCSIEIINSELYYRFSRKIQNKDEREHCTKIFYKNSEGIRIYNYMNKKRNDSSINLCVDTKEDYQNLMTLKSALDKSGKVYNYESIIRMYLDNNE